jgi:aspartyl/asparaginyl-tRNA synthetase
VRIFKNTDVRLVEMTDQHYHKREIPLEKISQIFKGQKSDKFSVDTEETKNSKYQCSEHLFYTTRSNIKCFKVHDLMLRVMSEWLNKGHVTLKGQGTQ